LIRKIFNLLLENSSNLKNIIWKSIQTFGKEGTAYIVFFICAKFLKPDEMGQYSYIMSIVFLIRIFSDFGISVTSSKYVAEYVHTNRYKANKIFFNSLFLIIIFTSISLLFLFFFRNFFLKNIFSHFLIMIPMLYFIPISYLYDGIFRGYKYFKVNSIISLVSGFLTLPILFGLIAKFGIYGAIWSQNILYFMLCLFSFFSLKEQIYKLDLKIIKNISSYSIFLGISNIGYYLFARVNIIIMGKYNIIEDIAYYDIINTIFLIMLVPMQIISSTVAPNKSKDFILKKYSSIKSKIVRETVLLFCIGLIVLLFSIILFPIIHKIVLTSYNFKKIYTLFILLGLLIPFRYFSSYLTTAYIIQMNLVILLNITLITSGLINVILIFLLIGKYGIFGVVTATLISQFFYIIIKDISFYIILFKSEKFKN